MFLLLTLNCLDILLGWFQFEQINTGSVFMSSKQAKSLILKQINLQQRLYTNLQEVSETACKLPTRHTKHGKSCPRVLLRSYMPPGWNAFYFYFCFESKSRFQSSCALLQSYRFFQNIPVRDFKWNHSKTIWPVYTSHCTGNGVLH